MPGSIERHSHMFCTQGCIKKFEKQPGSRKKWFRERIWQVSIPLAVLLAISYFVPALNPLFNAFIDYLALIWWAILLGLLIGGFIDYFVPREYISKGLAGSGKKAVFYATGLGFLMSACSHGILAISMELYKKGASVPAVVAFLLAAPWANLTVTVMLFGFFGVKAVFLVVSAVVIAIITGLVFQLLERKNLIEQAKPVKVEKGFSIREDARQRLRNYRFKPRDVTEVGKSSWALAKMVLWWILIGMLLASLASAFIPAQLFQAYLSASLLGLLATLVLATLIEVCSEGSSPMAFEIFRQTGAFGNSFVFLMAGVATDYTEIGLIWSNIGRKSALWLPIVTVPQILLLGYLFNLVL